MCLSANTIFVLSSQKQLGIKLQTANTLFEKTPLSCHEAYSAGARSALMRMRTRASTKKRDRDGKSAKRSEQDTAYSAVVVNDHMYPRPYIVFDPKRGHRNMKK